MILLPEVSRKSITWDQKSTSWCHQKEVARPRGSRRLPSDIGICHLQTNYWAHHASLRYLRRAHESAAHNMTIVLASPLRPDTFISTTVPAKDLDNDIMDVVSISPVGNYSGGEEELPKVFAGLVPLGEHWSYKYLIKPDGMSYSVRFTALLASDSATIKSMVYREYFSDWMQPWCVLVVLRIHLGASRTDVCLLKLYYIPLSPSYSEIYNIHAYFSGPSASRMDAVSVTVRRSAHWEAVQEERDAQLRQIARAGKQ